jgi:chorismate lyase / 3-hydroxybenzoate synthase
VRAGAPGRTAARSDEDRAADRPPPALSLTIEPADHAEGCAETCALPGSDAVLAHIDAGPAHWRPPADPRRLVVGLPPLGPALNEVWRVPGPVGTGWEDGIGFAAGPEVLFAHLLLPDDGGANLAVLACTAYTRLLGFVRARGFPHPLRIWNLIHRIHDRPGGLERYQAFCVGRERALHLAGISPAAYPAASAVGSVAPGLLVYLLAGRNPGTPVENPRQLAAWRYPRQYGPRPPSFARGLRAPWDGGRPVFVSGTAAVVGHRSVHPDKLEPQIVETLRNLDALLAQERTPPPDFLRIYLRDPCGLAQAQARLRDWLPADTPALWVQAQVCRKELAIEIEGVCGMGSPPMPP